MIQVPPEQHLYTPRLRYCPDCGREQLTNPQWFCLQCRCLCLYKTRREYLEFTIGDVVQRMEITQCPFVVFRERGHVYAAPVEK